MKYFKALFIFLYLAPSQLSFAQQPAFNIDLKEVVITNNDKRKTFSIGYCRYFSIAQNIYPLEKGIELATLINYDSSEYLIKKIFFKIALNEEDTTSIIFRLRNVTHEGLPGDEFLNKKLILIGQQRNDLITLNVEKEKIFLRPNGVFVSIQIADESKKNMVDIMMTSKRSSNYTYYKEKNKINGWNEIYFLPLNKNNAFNTKVELELEEF